MARGAIETVVWPPALKRRWHSVARAAWPREHYGILIGSRLGVVACIERIWSPPDVADYATEHWIAPQAAWMAEAMHIAEEDGLRVLGDIHTHPYNSDDWPYARPPDRSLSEGDVYYWAEGALAGITVVWQYGARLRASTVFHRAPGGVVTVELRR